MPAADKHMDQLQELTRMSSPMRLAAEEWKKPWQALISIILSARTRDEKTIPISNILFKKYHTAGSLAGAKLKDVQKVIKPINFYRTKSKNIITCAKILIKDYNGVPPKNFEKLLQLPGVGRKTANVFLTEMGKDAIGIDTHVAYISQKLGWTNSSKPEKIEEDLKKLFPQRHWNRVNQTLVRFGKTYTSRKKKDDILGKIRRL
jgi:endonuclease III